VAGIDLQDFPVSKYQMPDERREFHKIRPASHTLLSVNAVSLKNTAERKGVFTKLGRMSVRCADPVRKASRRRRFCSGSKWSLYARWLSTQSCSQFGSSHLDHPAALFSTSSTTLRMVSGQALALRRLRREWPSFAGAGAPPRTS